jgi:hypothetical protein
MIFLNKNAGKNATGIMKSKWNKRIIEVVSNHQFVKLSLFSSFSSFSSFCNFFKVILDEWIVDFYGHKGR